MIENLQLLETNETSLPFRQHQSTSNSINSWLSYAERNFIKVLDSVVDGEAFIFTKVKVSDILKNIDLDDCQYKKYQFVASQVFDYVLCDKKDLSVLCVMELDDRPHELQKIQAEYSYEEMCTELSIPLLEVPARCGYNKETLKTFLVPFLK